MKPILLLSFLLLFFFAEAQTAIDSLYLEADTLYSEESIDFDEIRLFEGGPCRFDLPLFPGGLDSLSKFILARFDASLYEKTISGVVYISFVIDTIGFIKDVRVARGINTEIDSSCLEIIKSLPKWLPAKDSKGNRIPLSCVMPFRFMASKED